ncbi:2-hydroxyacylsphingosine 1-beta-galactosyltransferase [Orchesella cincta]|uniref:UDP-glucuronosyltransferase n=1 Tax=Orchesella cincta TaxID=48709 RepID=A0A1D2MSY3_ORCCI|nr:2-hydroxyacylsphingosine 1-beta-galactosyltransferase [Orchesella cincta]
MRNTAIFSFVVLSLITITLVEGANILFVHTVASYSHIVVTRPLAQALAQRGHQVTILSPFYFKEPNPNITELVPDSVSKFVDHWLNSEFDINLRVTKTNSPLVSHIFSFGIETCKLSLTSPELHEWLNKTRSLDLVIIDNAVAECAVGIAYKYGAKHIFFSTVISHPHENDFFGVLPESFAIPELEDNPVISPMSFFDRLRNTVTSLIWMNVHSSYIEQVDKLIRTHLQMPNMPYLYDLARNASLVFYTGDPVTDFPRSHPPMFVDVAGIHCQKSGKPLPIEIQAFLNGAHNGFVYISLGSYIMSSNLPEDILYIFFQVIEAFPNIKFLWKWDGDFPEKIPNNLLMAQWFPQKDVLAHPMVRVFVTQSGRPSTLESVYNAVPMIAFPVIGDQDNNANRVNNMGGNIKLELGTVTFEELREAIADILSNPEWKHRMQELQTILRDRPMSPLNTACGGRNIFYVTMMLTI